MRKIQSQNDHVAVPSNHNSYSSYNNNRNDSYGEPEPAPTMYQSRDMQPHDYMYPPMPPPQDNSFNLTPMYAPGVNPSNAHDNDDDAEIPMFPVDIAGAEQGGIEAFVAENVVDATGVAVLKSDEEEELEVKRRQRKMLVVVGIILTIILIVVIVPVSLVVGGKEKEIPVTPPPSMSPSMSPSAAPTSIEIPRTGKALALYSSEEKLADPTSPQGKALAWIVNNPFVVIKEDTSEISFRDPKFIQRYIMAVFYYSMDGDNWDACYKDDPKCQSDPKARSWLSEQDECSWNLLDCDEEGFVSTMDFRM